MTTIPDNPDHGPNETATREGPAHASQPVYFSVVVCTYNRAELLTHCLESLKALDACRGGHEIIVVDNNSTDGTRHTVEAAMADAPQLRYVFEPTQGLAHARNRGVAESRGRYIAFIDDECLVPAQWLVNAETLCLSESPDIAGGPVDAWFLEGSKPAWFLDSYSLSYLKEEGMISQQVDKTLMAGGNIFIDKTVFTRVGLFDPDLGMVGHRIDYGEETELQMRLRAHPTGAKIWFDPDLAVTHLVRPEKMRLSWAFRDFIQRGRAEQKLRKDRDKTRFHAALSLVIRAAGIPTDILYAYTIRNRRRYRAPQNYLYEMTCRRRAFRMGMYLQELGW